MGDYGVYRAGADGIAIYGARAGVLGGGHVWDRGCVGDSAGLEVNRLEDQSAVIVCDEIDEFAVGREMGIGDHAVEGEGEDFGGAAGGGRDGEMVGGIVEEFRVEHGDVGDGLAVGGPCGRHVDAGICGDLGEVGAFVWVVDVGWNNPDVRVVVGIGVAGRAVAGEGEEFAVGRPGGFGVVEVTAGDLGQRFFGDVEDVEMGAAAVEVADFVDFKLEAVDDPGPFGFGLFVIGVGVRGS